jgi:hemoglobin-like flavoprotein
VNAELLRSSWREMSRFGDQVSAWFYASLFIAHPETRRLFGSDMAEQRRKITATLTLVVRSAHDLDAVVPVLQRLGRDHRRFGAVEAHYAAVGESLLGTLAYFLGEGWTPEVADTWTEAYGAVADVMITAARDADEAEAPSFWDCPVLYLEASPGRDQVYLVFGAPDLGPATDGLAVPVALHGTPGDWLVVHPFGVDGGWAAYIDVTGDPRTLALAQARAGDVLRVGPPLAR